MHIVKAHGFQCSGQKALGLPQRSQTFHMHCAKAHDGPLQLAIITHSGWHAYMVNDGAQLFRLSVMTVSGPTDALTFYHNLNSVSGCCHLYVPIITM